MAASRFSLLLGVALSAAPGLCAAAWPSAADTTDLDLNIAGNSLNGNLGRAVAAVYADRVPASCPANAPRDFNGDGVPDLAVGVPGSDSSRGKVLVYFGRVGFPPELKESDANVSLTGDSVNSAAGNSIGVGDVNGDCLADLIIGATGATRAYIVLGSSSRWGRVGDPAVTQGLGEVTRLTGLPTSTVAYSISARADASGDGISDILIGASQATYNTTQVGRVYLVHGKASFAASIDLTTQADASWRGTAAGEEAGFAVDLLPGMGAGGRAAVAIGAPGYSSGIGRAYFIKQSPANTRDIALTSTNVPSIFDGSVTAGRAGESVAGPGDVNGDDLPDLAIGAPRATSSQGQVYLRLGTGADLPAAWGPASSGVVTISGEAGASSTGLVRPFGDLNQDGMDDLAIGAPDFDAPGGSNHGRIYVLFGRASWSSGGVSGANFRLTGQTAQKLAQDFAAAVDLDKDGAPDLAVGSPLASVAQVSNAGRVWVVRAALFVDGDGDGASPFDGDCDDLDPELGPDAEDVPCDGVDQDCDGADLTDADEDTYSGCEDAGPGQFDCDDSDPTVNPGAPEVCDNRDQNCDGRVDNGVDPISWPDGDGDGYGADDQGSCQLVDGWVTQGGDCDDEAATTNPAAPEACNGADDNCDGVTDEGVTLTFYRDEDGDGFGGQSPTQDGCSPDEGFVAAPGDCDDGEGAVNPAAEEICGDGADNDCSGAVDDRDADGDGFPASQCGGQDCDDARDDIFPGASEACDTIDNDCDGSVDEGPVIDSDGDGQTPKSCGGTDCNDNDPSIYFGAVDIPYDGEDQDCDGTDPRDVDQDGAEAQQVGGDDCDDDDPTRHPGADELCDAVDQDCDGLSADRDIDGDGAFDTACVGGTDCDDQDAGVFPGAEEVCDGQDNNCNGRVDDKDLDQDGAFDQACGGEDCDDTDEEVGPEGEETCDGVDEDCDGLTDNLDDDGDGAYPLECGGEDCDDGDEDVYPGAEERCDGVDEDCDGQVDDRDADGDGEISDSCGGPDCEDGDDSILSGAEEVPYDGVDQDCADGDLVDVDGDGFPSVRVSGGTDCDDQDPQVRPGQAEVVDGLDQNCNGVIDEPGDPVAFAQAPVACAQAPGGPSRGWGAALAALVVVAARRRRATAPG